MSAAEREAFLAGWRYAAESMVQAHDPLVTLIAEAGALLIDGKPRAATVLDRRTLDAMAEVQRVRLDPGASDLAYAVWRLGQR
jgi:hypothetical protein